MFRPLLPRLVLVASSLVACSLCAEDVDYQRDIKPILRDRCFACHGVLKQQSDLRVDTGDFLRSGGASGPAIVPGDLKESLLLERVSATDIDERMPPEGDALTADQIALLETWVATGAATPPDEQPQEDPRDHWAFQPPVKVDLPSVVDEPWSHHPIDRLIAAGHREWNLQPVGVVDRRLLLRRVSLDLTGLPPTEEQYASFLNDDSPKAYEHAVDLLLASPHYGERGGRQWMDVWRYTDWYGLGYQLRNSQKHIWHWRDWIVDSLNDDKGYDRMIVEMFAADEVAPTDRETLRATGYLARNYYLFNRTTWLDDTIEHTAKAFLGLTMNCTKCHDHKYDPISQVDYYRFRAIFEPYQVRLDAVPGETDFDKNGLPRVFDLHPEIPTYLHVRGDPKQPDLSEVITPGVPAIFDRGQFEVHPVELPAEAYRPELQPFVLEDQLAEVERVRENLQAELKTANRLRALALQRANTTELLTSLTSDSSLGSAQPETRIWIDDFVTDDAELWEAGPGNWSCTDGNLQQRDIGAERRYMRSRLEHPADFVARLRFRIHGGQKWKSVGLAFDVQGDQEKLVYLSGVSPGSKLQVSYRDESGNVYPSAGRLDRAVALNQTYDLMVAVRDRLMNIVLDGQLVLVYELPVQRMAGFIDLVSFDSLAEFEHVEICRLPEDIELVPTTVAADDNSAKLTLAQADAAVAVCERRLSVCELRPKVLRTAHAADVARAASASSSAEKASELVRAAARAARELELAKAESAVAELRRDLAAARTGNDKKKTTELDKKLSTAMENVKKAAEAIEQPGETYTSLRASLKAPEGPDESEASQLAPYPNTSTGRRTALARWMASPNNPLTARVAVNHIWLRHFGQPLVESVSDFGLRAPRPPQQKLLDWLAVEFMESGWSIKQLHRLIVTSRLYQLDTSRRDADPQTIAADPKNEYYWCRMPIRMESQVIRDSLLTLAGKLDSTLGGPTIDPKQKDKVYRRSLYFTHSRDVQHKFLSMFDDADILRCYRRSESIVPQQALTLANSELALSMAREITARLQEQDGAVSDEEFVVAAFKLLLAKTPTEEERATCGAFLAKLHTLPAVSNAAMPDVRARENLVHALINHNDFVTIR